MADIDINALKRCSKCRECKPRSEFSLSKRSPDGRYPQCKACRSAAHRNYYGKNRDAVLAKNKAWHESNPDRTKEHVRNWQKRNRKHLTDYSRQYRADRPGLGASYAMKDYWINREARLDANRRYRAKNPEKCAEIARQWKADNPEQALALKRNYKARKRNAEGSHTAEDIISLYAIQEGRCYYCDDPLGLDYHVDHRQPLSRSGSNDPDNLAIACCPCNLSKKDKTEAEFFAIMKREAA